MTFSRFHPLVIACYYGITFFMAVTTKNPVLLFVVLIAVITHHFLMTSFIKTSKNIAYYIVVTLIIIILSASFKHNGVTPLFFWNEQAVTRETLFWALMIGILCMFLSFIYQNFIVNLPMDKILYLCRRVWPTFGIYSALFFRLLPAYKNRWQQMHAVQKSIGYYATASFFDKLSGLLKTAYGCAIWSFEQCFHKSDVMRARGFHLKNKTTFFFYKWQLADTLLLLLLLLLVGIFFTFYHQATFFYFPYTKEVTVPKSIFYSCIIIAIIPLVIEWRERMKWHYYNLKM